VTVVKKSSRAGGPKVGGVHWTTKRGVKNQLVSAHARGFGRIHGDRKGAWEDSRTKGTKNRSWEYQVPNTRDGPYSPPRDKFSRGGEDKQGGKTRLAPKNRHSWVNERGEVDLGGEHLLRKVSTQN